MLRLTGAALRVHLFSPMFAVSCLGTVAVSIIIGINVRSAAGSVWPFLLSLIILAFPASFGIGVEFSDGTVRNKIVSGVTKTRFYLSQLAAVITEALIMFLLTLIPYDLIVFKRLLPSGNVKIGLCSAGLILLMYIGFAVIFTFILCLTQTKVAVLLCGALCIGLILGERWAESNLQYPEKYYMGSSELFLYDEKEENIIDSIVTEETAPNNSYVHDPGRYLLYAGYRLSPVSCAGIARGVSGMSPDTFNSPDKARENFKEMEYEFDFDFMCSAYIDLWKAVVWTLGECAVLTLLGILIFGKRNIQ